jgi:hypothetical protein
MAFALLDFARRGKYLGRDIFDQDWWLFSIVFHSCSSILMNQRFDNNQNRTTVDDREKRNDQSSATFTPPQALWQRQDAYTGLKLIPWSEIWASIAVAKLRGNTEMLKMFYETLYKEGVFDDRGVWALNSRPRN